MSGERRQRLSDPDVLGAAIGARLLEITDEPANELEESGNDLAHFHFDNGVTIVVDFPNHKFMLEYPE